MKERVQVKHDTAENWAKAVNFVPLSGELIVYDGIMEDGIYTERPRIKIGDGVHNVNDLPFIDTSKPNVQIKDGVLKIK